MLATVYGDIGASEECSFLRAQVDDQTGDLVRLAQAVEWNLWDDFAIEDVLRNGHHHFGSDVARGNGIDGDALPRHLKGQRLGETVHACLRRGVIRLAEGPLLAIHR